MTPQQFKWKFPLKKILLLKIEIVLLTALSILIFLATFFQFGQQWGLAILFALLFLAIHVILSFLIQKWRAVEEEYHLTPTHLHVTRKERNKVVKETIDLKHIIHHKLDKFFLGGYLMTKKSRHSLFFNTEKEVKKFEQFLKRHLKKKKF